LEFEAIEDFGETLNSLGFSLDCRQLQRGALKTNIDLFSVANIDFIRQSSNLTVETHGEYASGFITIIITAENTKLSINNQVINADEIMVVNEKMEAIESNPYTHQVFNILIPKNLFYVQLAHLHVDFPPNFSFLKFKLTNEHARLIRASIKSNCEAKQSIFQQFENEGVFISILSKILNQKTKTTSITQKKLSDQKLLRRAKEFIRNNSTCAFTLHELCRFLGTSLSTVERLFKKELNMTPTNYMVAYRISMVRKEILAYPETKISDIALKYGFYHLGRLSSLYKAYFGCLPSQDKRRVFN